MNKSKLLQVSMGLAAFALIAMPLKSAMADNAAIDAQIQDLKNRIEETRQNYREDGVKVEQRINKYEERIAQLKNDASKPDTDNGKSLSERASDIRRDFDEWRLKRSIDSYADKIDDVRIKARYESNPDKKLELEERIKKLDAKFDAARAKLADLRITNRDNWDAINNELNASLKEIDREYDAMEAGQ